MIFNANIIEIISIIIIRIIKKITYSSIWGLVPTNCCVCWVCKSLQNILYNDEDDDDDDDDDYVYDDNNKSYFDDDDDKLPWGPSSLVPFHLCGPTGRESYCQNWNTVMTLMMMMIIIIYDHDDFDVCGPTSGESCCQNGNNMTMMKPRSIRSITQITQTLFLGQIAVPEWL